MNIPQDPVMLLSVINTALRDRYKGLDELCSAEDIDRSVLEEKLRQIDYAYDPSHNQFI